MTDLVIFGVCDHPEAVEKARQIIAAANTTAARIETEKARASAGPQD